jgi:hypothetical protein
MKRTKKIVAAMALTGGLALGAVGLGTGVASASPGPAFAGPIAEHPWGPPPPPAPWGPPPPPAWGGGWNNGWNGGGPIPGGWNGGWEPQGGFCVFVVCV